MNTAEFEQWYYLIYLLPGGIALLLLLLTAVGGGARHHHHVGGGSGHSHQGAGGIHTAHHHAAPHSHGTARGAPSAGQSLLSFFGIGRIPLPFIWGSLLLGWGLFGTWGTHLLQTWWRFPALFVLPGMAIAVGGALVTAKVTAEFGARLLPQTTSFATTAVELCGLTGTAAFPVGEARGRVHIYDVHGTMHDVSARIAPGGAPIERGRTVLVTDYDAAQGYAVVEEVG